MNKDSPLTPMRIFIGVLLDLAIGRVIGITQNELGTSTCSDLAFGMIAGGGIGITIEKLREGK